MKRLTGTWRTDTPVPETRPGQSRYTGIQRHLTAGVLLFERFREPAESQI